MREIKFRAWNQKREFMGEPEDIFEMTTCRGQISSYVEGTVLMQFTGLHDKNGKEIYEGDIAVVHPALAEDEKREAGRRYSVVYNAPEWMLELPNGARWSQMSGCEQCGSYVGGGDGWWRNQIEIIGNIYETPELLTTAHVVPSGDGA